MHAEAIQPRTPPKPLPFSFKRASAASQWKAVFYLAAAPHPPYQHRKNYSMHCKGPADIKWHTYAPPPFISLCKNLCSVANAIYIILHRPQSQLLKEMKINDMLWGMSGDELRGGYFLKGNTFTSIFRVSVPRLRCHSMKNAQYKDLEPAPQYLSVTL